MGSLEPQHFGEHFHEIFISNFDARSKLERSSRQRNKNKDKRKDTASNESNHLTPPFPVLGLEVEPNASKFAVFSAVRSAVLEAETTSDVTWMNILKKKATRGPLGCCALCHIPCRYKYNPECRCHTALSGPNIRIDDNDSDGDSDSDNSTERESVQKVPQIIGAGLKSLFELIAEARHLQPSLCTKALKAVLDVIQGQSPESFKSEPNELINPLYDLLLDLATLHGPGTSDKNDANNWSAIGCSALLGLSVARGDTGKILRAVAALLMSPKILSSQNIHLPIVLSSLQRSVHSLTLGKSPKPDYFKNGIPLNSQIDQFSLKNQMPPNIQYTIQPSIASDGKFLFILVSKILLKIGSGFNGTLKGHVYASNYEFGKDKNGWIGFCNDTLYYKRLSKRSNDSVLIVNTESLTITGSAQIAVPSVKDGQHLLLFSDGESLNALSTAKDDSLVVKQIHSMNTISSFDLQLKLARKHFRTLGYANFEDEVLTQHQIQKIQSTFNPFEPKLQNDMEVANIVCGKEFGLVRSANGKVFYYGKATAIGLKSIGKSPTLKMTELIISKVASIIQIALGHDGIHALLVNDDGSVYFTGSARRGEDGDTSKNRRQPRATKPKKISRIEGHFIVHASCNNGTSAFVTKTGKLIVFGKDTTHCDAAGYVTELYDQHITKVALGKAHTVVLNSKGHLITFGLNNKGQCGRVFSKDKEVVSSAMETSLETQKSEKIRLHYDMSNMCDPDDHSIIHGKCRVCSVCKECTGYNITCVTTMGTAMADRVPGTYCACGHGDAGCSKCGACFTCIKYQESMTDDGTNEINYSLLGRQRTKHLVAKKDRKLEDGQIGSDIERDAPRVAPLPPQKVILPTSSPVIQISCGLHHTVVLTLAGEVFTFGSNQYGQLGTGDLQPVQGPVQVKVPGLISQVAAGSNHTVLLTMKGIVYTFGNYQKGQLGRLPADSHSNANLNDAELAVQLHDNKIEGIAEESGSTIQKILIHREKFLWNCTPGIVPGIGPNHGKRASWIGASGDQTFIKIDESLITASMISKVNAVADRNTILLIPTIPSTFNCLAINRRDGTCNAHTKNQVDFAKIIQTNNSLITKTTSDDKCNQNLSVNEIPIQQHEIDRMSQSIHEARNHNIFDVEDEIPQRVKHHPKEKGGVDKILPQLAFYIDSVYGVLWVFDAVAKQVTCYNVMASEMKAATYKAILFPEVALPSKSNFQVTRSQASLNLLACLDILTSVEPVNHILEALMLPIPPPSLPKETMSNNQEYQVVCRFESFGGGWGYSGHSVEAIRFMSDSDIILGGFGMFGGRGEYTCKIKLFDLGYDGGSVEKEGILACETDEVPYECPARNRYNVMLPKPIRVLAGKWYLVWVKISGPSSDCGSSGQSTVTTEDQVVFSFKSTKKANNGTDVNSGQIPSILYKVITQETNQVDLLETDSVHKISRGLSNTVTRECFESLVLLLNWAWGTFKVTLLEFKDKKKYLQSKTQLDNLVFISRACLRLIKKYVNEIYPNEVFSKTEKSAPKKEVTIPPVVETTELLNKNNLQFNYENKLNAVLDPIPPQPLPSTSKGFSTITIQQPKLFAGGGGAGSVDGITPTNPKKVNSENLQLAECIGDVRALLIQILRDDIQQGLENEGQTMADDIFDECHNTFVSCFNAFYPTSTLKWNCLCDLLTQMDRGILHSKLLSGVLAGLCSPTVKLRSTFSLLTPVRECKSVVSPSDNSGLPMLTSTEHHMYPVLVEQMIYRTQQEKCEFAYNSWTFKDVLVRLLDIVSYPIRSKIENAYSNRISRDLEYFKAINQGLIDNCCNLLARVLAEIVYQSCTSDFDISLLSTRSLHSTGTRFARCDLSRTWNTGNFGPDAIAFTVDRPGIAIAGAMVYSGSGNYEYQLELLYDTLETKSLSHRWEILESVSGSYDQDAVQNEMAEIKFDRPVPIKEKTKYALRLCSQGARTCSGDNGLSSLRGPCGTTFLFFPCDLSFNGTTPARGQIPCILYYSTPMKNDAYAGKFLYELHARDTALHIASDITKRCTELLIIARNAIALSITPSDKSPNSSNNTQTIDSEHNITPTIEEHLDISWTNNLNNSASEPNNSTARDFTKKIESISKGIMESLKLDKRASKPFEYEIEIGSTDINPIDLLDESDGQEEYWRNGKMSKINGNNRYDVNDIGQSDSDDSITQISRSKILEMFEMKDSSLFHTLLPLIFAHIGPLVNSDPKSSVQVLSLIKEILPHVAALNQLYSSQDSSDIQNDSFNDRINKLEKSDPTNSLCTTSNHFCIVECDHPYKSASISTYRLQFPPCVQWFSIEFDPQSGTAQPEDTLLIQIPNTPISYPDHDEIGQLIMNRNHHHTHHNHANSYNLTTKNVEINQKLAAIENAENEHDWLTVKSFNTSSNWPTNAIIFPGNRIQISLETASEYLKDQKSNHFGFKCLIIGYDNPSLIKFPNFCLIQLEHELSYLGGMCGANLMKKDLILPDDKMENLYSIENTLSQHSGILSKGLALPDSLLTINQVLDSQFPKGGQSNERQFLKDFVTGAPGSSGARLAAWLQPEPRLDPNRCELKQIPEPVRYGWPTSLTVITRDQYGDNVFVPDLKIEIKAVPAGAVANVGRKLRKSPQADTFSLGGMPLPPKMSYEATVKEKACFNAITFMKVYQQYSFEELRFSSPIQTRVTETIIAHDLGDGTFGATWTPNSVGSYCITVTIDGIPLEEVFRIEVKEAGILPLSKGHKKNSQPPNRIRKFISKNSSGLRIRSHPTLQSEQVGIIKLNGILTFIDEIENDDGVWVRLSTESIRQHCTSGWYPTEAWCLQYNQHLGKTLLHPVIENQSCDLLSGAGKMSVLEKIKKNSETQIDILDVDNGGDTQKMSSGSPSKKGFEFTTSKFTPPLSAESASIGSAPFVFSSNYSSTKTSPKILTTSKDSAEDMFEEKKPSHNKENKLDSQSSVDQFFLSGSSIMMSQSPSQSNIGTTIAGVVGGGASKLQALQKWLKGDSVESKDVQKRRNDLPDFPSVSVRDLVKAIGGQDVRNNGNTVTPPLLSRSSSPVAIPLRHRELHSNQSSGSKSAEVSDTSALVSSITRDLSQSPSQSSFRDDEPSIKILEHQTSESDESFAQTAVRGTNFAIGSAVQPSSSATGSVYSKELIEMRPDEASLPADFNLGPGFNFKFDALGNNVQTGDEANKSSSSAGSDKLNNPLKWPTTTNTTTPPTTTTLFASSTPNTATSGGSGEKAETVKTNVPKRALPPSLAETLRAVFAAFLWHEGIVHDAMACASFLKFHPTLPKQGAVVVTRGDGGDARLTLSKEERAQQRHSVEVANAGSYLNIRPSTLETLTKSGNSSIRNRRYRNSNVMEGGDSDEKTKLQSLPEIITVLPPALRSLVYLWEQLCNNCVQLVQSNALDQFQENNANAERQLTTTTTIVAPVAPTENLDNNLDKDFRNVRKKKKEDTTFCELCETFIPIPITHHMRTVHPGCGKSSKGKGYNSVGNYCAGWAGNCGEGGKGASSWYLICDKCREKFMNGIKNSNNVNAPVAEQFISPTATTTQNPVKVDNLFGLKTSLILNSEIYTMMKDNALFLLELSSTTSSSLNTNQKKSPQQMPIVSESHINNMMTDFARPGTSRNSREIKLSGSKANGSATTSRVPYATSTQNLRKSSNLSTSVSPELLWAAPEVFSCLDALGATVTNELPYEIFGFHDNGYERPLSDVSFESIDPNSVDVGPQQATGTLSKFHRSLSMGQGWSVANQSNKFYNQQTSELSGQDQVSRVVLRRKHHNNEGKDNLLLCYPSANLRKIVPESIIAASCVAPSNSSHSQRLCDNPTIALKHLSLLEDGHNSNLEDFNISDYNELKNSLRANSIENNSEPIYIKETGDNKTDDGEKKPPEPVPVPADIINPNEPDENSISLLSRPSMSFILQQHDLEKLRNVMKRSLRIATCRIYSLQALNWMLKSVTQANCLHDLMWWFIAALTHSTQISNIEENLKVDDAEPALEHPVTSTQNSGKLATVLSQSLHSYLQTVADLTLLLPGGSALQRIAIQCFGIRFRQADHQFLHRSHVFSNISKILSKSDEQNEDMLISSLHESNSNVLSGGAGYPSTAAGSTAAQPNLGGIKMFNFIDLQGLFEVTVSSRQALANSLIDNSTETFWESDEEDRNKAKIIEISLSKLNYVCKLIYVHVDNSRDIGNKVSHITFYAGQSLGDTNHVRTVEANAKTSQWIQVNIKDDTATHFRLEFRGPENSLRVRQIKLLGYSTHGDDSNLNVKYNPKLTNAYQIQQRNCETETLRVFRLITGQVFGKLIVGTEQSNIDLNIVQQSIMETSSTSLIADSLDMREHMVGILFSRSKLSHLQKQVIVHIVHAIRKEAQRAKEEWDMSNTCLLTNAQNNINLDGKSDSGSEHSRAPDIYCFEMLSMVLALSGSVVGRSYLSHQHGLLKDLLSLLHTGSDRVQRQVTALLRRMLPEISPESLGELLCVQKMPPQDFSIAHHNIGEFDMTRLGILDIFLAVIAKSLQLQVKVKTQATTVNKNPTLVKLTNCIDITIHNIKLDSNSLKRSVKYHSTNPFEMTDFELENEEQQRAATHHHHDKDFEIKKKSREISRNLNQRWFLKGTISVKQAENIIGLIKDMTAGKLTEKWSLVTKAAIAESILNLTRLDEVFRTPDNCIKTATLWLALASLCVLDRDHVEKLSSAQWSKACDTRPLCTNHDDGTTPAVIQCDPCGALCNDCDRFLHLSRKSRNHHRTVCKEEEEAIRVELHESCGRTKLFWLLALADSKTLKGMVEFRDGNNTIISEPPNSVGRCRFCGITGTSGLLAVGNVCADAQCQEYAENACVKIRPCGHGCGGVAGEQKCLPCLQHTCHAKENETAEVLKEPKLTQDADDMCMICFTEALSCAPSIQLDCGHVFHFHCCKAVIVRRWTGPRISFGFSQCPICKADIAHSALTEILEPINTLKNDVKRKALMRMEYEGIAKVSDHKDLASYAMDRFAYYVCFKCQKAYYGGEARCDAEMVDKYNPQELVCGGCSDVAQARMCPKHGTDFLEYKCRYCCSVAVFFCFGTTHFCDTCHDDFQHLTNIPKIKLPRCPAGPKATQLLGDDCPLHIVHPPTGEEFALGCGICRNAQTF